VQSKPTHQTAEAPHVPSASPDLAASAKIQDIVTSGNTMPYPLSRNLHPPTFCRFSSITQTPILLQINRTSHHHPCSNSWNTLSTGTSLSLRSIIATAVLSASPVPTSITDLGAIGEDNGSAVPGLRKENDALQPPSANHATCANANLINTPDSQLSSLPSPVTGSDIAIAGSSPQKSKAERTGDHPPDPARYQYDIV
jgi:hypothetical protein